MKTTLSLLLILVATVWSTPSAEAQEPMIGEIRMFAGNFAPKGWALCDGQLLAISQNTALFSILGTTFGGDGRTVFALPDLRGRVPMHAGSGPGLTPRRIGNKGGAETTTVKKGEDKKVEGRPYTVINYIIATQGVYPSRN